MRLDILMALCPSDLEKELMSQQHLFPKYQSMRDHIIQVIQNRTPGIAPMLLGNIGEETGSD